MAPVWDHVMMISNWDWPNSHQAIRPISMVSFPDVNIHLIQYDLTILYIHCTTTTVGNDVKGMVF